MQTKYMFHFVVVINVHYLFPIRFAAFERHICTQKVLPSHCLYIDQLFSAGSLQDKYNKKRRGCCFVVVVGWLVGWLVG